MGSHSMQAVALTVFILAAVLVAAGAAMGGNILILVAGFAVLAFSAVLFRKCKAVDEGQS